MDITPKQSPKDSHHTYTQVAQSPALHHSTDVPQQLFGVNRTRAPAESLVVDFAHPLPVIRSAAKTTPCGWVRLLRSVDRCGPETDVGGGEERYAKGAKQGVECLWRRRRRRRKGASYVCVCVIIIEGRQRLVKVGGGGILLLWGFSVCRTAIVRIDPVAFYH